MPTPAPYPAKAFNNEQYFTVRIGATTHRVNTSPLSVAPPVKNQAQVSKQILSWFAANQFHTADQKNFPALLWDYCVIAAPNTQTAFGSSPIPQISNPLDVLKNLLDPAFWLRIGEFLLGALLLGIGVAHLFPETQATLKSIPGYGKVIP